MASAHANGLSVTIRPSLICKHNYGSVHNKAMSCRIVWIQNSVIILEPRLSRIDLGSFVEKSSKRSIFQTFWRPDSCPDLLFFEIETSNFGYLLIF